MEEEEDKRISRWGQGLERESNLVHEPELEGEAGSAQQEQESQAGGGSRLCQHGPKGQRACELADQIHFPQKVVALCQRSRVVHPCDISTTKFRKMATRLEWRNLTYHNSTGRYRMPGHIASWGSLITAVQLQCHVEKHTQDVAISRATSWKASPRVVL